MSTSACDFIVVGGGIVGLATAAALARDGERVVVLDRAPGPSAEASGAAAGILSLLYPWECPSPVQALGAYSAGLYADWCARLGGETGWARPGVLSFDADGAPADIERLSAEEIRARMPEVAPPTGEGLWLPEVACVEPRRLGRALARYAASVGVDCRWGADVESLMVEHGRVTGVRTAAGTVRAGAVIVAAGAWARGLLAPLGIEVPIRPVRGQILELAGPPGLLSTILVHDHRYILPRADGRIVVGSTSEDVGFDVSVTPDAARQLRKAAATVLPRAADMPVRAHWAGLRPGSPDGVPLIGPAPGVDGLWLNVGHFRSGILLGPGSAALLAALVAGRSPPVDPAPFAPASMVI